MGSRSGTSAAIVGREREQAIIETLLENGRTGGTGALVFGAPGVGKSFLLEFARDRADAHGMRTISAFGVESEAQLAFAGLQQLLQPLLAGTHELPAPQRRALEVAIGIADGPQPELFLVGLASLSLLTEAASVAPLLLIVDDAQWLDQSTLAVLSFIARRLDADPIVLLAATRAYNDTALDTAPLRRLDLPPLTEESARQLLLASAPDLPSSVVEQVVALSEGNPLALVELPSALASDRHGLRERPAEPVALTERLTTAFTARVNDLTDETRAMLLIAAINDSDSVSEIRAAAAVLLTEQAELDSLTAAQSAGLITLSDGAVRFRHPLVRTAIRQIADSAARYRAHAALAQVLTEEPDRRIWHMAAATVDSDDSVAEQLEDVALRAQRRGALMVASGALERAAALSESKARRAELLVHAAEVAVDVAPPERISEIVAKAQSTQPHGVQAGRLTLVRELVAPTAAGEPSSVTALVNTATRMNQAGQQRLALRLLWAAATGVFHVDADARTRSQIVAACEQLAVPDDDPLLMSALALASPIANAELVIERCLAVEPAPDGDPDAFCLLGTALCTVGAAVLADGFFGVAAPRLRAAGRIRPLARLLALRAMGSFLLGNWAAADVDATEAASFAAESGQPIWAAAALSASAMLAGARGDTRAEEFASQAEQLALPSRGRAPLAMVQMARGLTALSAGQYEIAFWELQRMFDPGDLACHSAKSGRALGLLAEAALRSGHHQEALEILNRATPAVERSASPWQRLSARHAAALLAEDGEAEQRFEAALAVDLSRWPFERARLQLAYGGWLRRRRRAADSRAPLRAARDTFTALGAAPWGDRATQELRASGERSRRRVPETRDQLSPQEMQIAGMAAAGLSNREIGERLYLSHRTVASHLYRIFPKLGITSRADLGSALAAARAPARASVLTDDEHEHSVSRVTQANVPVRP